MQVIAHDVEMTRRIKRIAPLQAGKMMGVLHAYIGGIEVEVEVE